MIVSALKSFGKNLKYYFTPLGTVFLFLVIGLALAVPQALAAVNELASSVRGLLSDAHLDVDAFRELFMAELAKLPPGLTDAINYIMTTSWLQDTLNDLFASFTGNAQMYAEQIELAVAAFSGEIIACLSLVVLFAGLGLAVGFRVTRLLIRREIARRSVLKSLLAAVLHALLVVLVVLATGLLFLVWKPGGVLLIVLAVLLYGFVNLVEAYFVHARGRLPFRKVVRLKNIFALYAGYVVVLALASAFAALAVWLAGALIGGIVSAPLFVIAVIVNSMIDEAYVCSLAEDAEEGAPPINEEADRGEKAENEADSGSPEGEAPGDGVQRNVS